MRIRAPRTLLALVVCVTAACSDRDLTAPVPGGMERAADRHSNLVVRDIRIGVVQSAAAITLGSAADYAVADKVSGVVLFSGSAGSVTVTFAAAPPAFYRLQVMCASATTVATRIAAAQALGYQTATEYVPGPNCTRLFLGEFPSNASFAVRNPFRNKAIADGLAGTDSFWKVVSFGSATYRVTRDGVSLETGNPVVVTSSSGIVTINGLRYRGKGEARANGSGTLAGINELLLEQYLYGVLPRELGPIAYPEIEAQKAQAVAARTFAVAGFNRRASEGYDLRATTDDQVYGGYGVEHPVSNGAVDATAGLVATWNGNLISTLYSSASGGHTADNEESFAGTPLPYLRGVPDAQRGRALGHVPSLEVFRAHRNPTSLRAVAQGDLESDWSRYHRWTFEWSSAEIEAIVSAFAKQDVGRVLAINVLERGPSGRVLRLAYVTDAGTFLAEKFAIRSSLTYITSTGGLASLPSTLFFVEEVRDPRTKALRGFRAWGGGFGHGVGLSQTGAVGMAEKGASYDEILRHYYQGIELARWY